MLATWRIKACLIAAKHRAGPVWQAPVQVPSEMAWVLSSSSLATCQAPKTPFLNSSVTYQ